MAIRTIRSQVTFNASFALAELDGPLPSTWDVQSQPRLRAGNVR